MSKDIQIRQVYSSHTHFVEIFLPPSCVRIDELEHKRFLDCPPCIAAASHKSFCLDDPQSQSPCEQASIAPPCLWTV